MQGIVGKRGALVAALAAIAGGVLAVGVAAHTSRDPSSISITVPPSESYLYGVVSSPNADCPPHRKIRVFRTRPGDDKLFRRTHSLGPAHGFGQYTVSVETGTLRSGIYYSKVKESDLKPGDRHAHICKGDRSDEVGVGP